MQLSRLAQILYGLGFAGLGVLGLRSGDFALSWQPVPDGVPARTFLAYVSGTILLAAGAGLLVPRAARRSAIVLTGFVALWLLALQVPRVVHEPGDAGVWLGFGENVLSVTGGWALVVFLTERDGRRGGVFFDSDGGLRVARVLFALALPVIGLSHFVYLDFTTQMIPAWLPARRGFAVLTGAGHMAAGLGLLLGIFRRLAATLEAAMLSCFVLLLHGPGVVAAPTSRLQWTMLCVATAFTGAAWAIAGSLGGERWLRVPWRR
ncbi:MAG TPA: hypothetical protein VHE13_05475 [Opitutus sp.]|nr:hypothetical protein [Opitutus sp.]